MSEFAPCPSCRRHVRARSEGCPFCGAKLDVGEQQRRVHPGVDARLGRAAAIAAASLTIAACNASPVTQAPAYGAPPPTPDTTSVTPVVTPTADPAVGGAGGASGGTGGAAGQAGAGGKSGQAGAAGKVGAAGGTGATRKATPGPTDRPNMAPAYGIAPRRPNGPDWQ